MFRITDSRIREWYKVLLHSGVILILESLTITFCCLVGAYVYFLRI